MALSADWRKNSLGWNGAALGGGFLMQDRQTLPLVGRQLFLENIWERRDARDQNISPIIDIAQKMGNWFEMGKQYKEELSNKCLLLKDYLREKQALCNAGIIYVGTVVIRFLRLHSNLSRSGFREL